MYVEKSGMTKYSKMYGIISGESNRQANMLDQVVVMEYKHRYYYVEKKNSKGWFKSRYYTYQILIQPIIKRIRN